MNLAYVVGVVWDAGSKSPVVYMHSFLKLLHEVVDEQWEDGNPPADGELALKIIPWEGISSQLNFAA